MVCQANGVVGLYTIEGCELISFVNEPTWSPELQELFQGKYDRARRNKRIFNKKKRKIENFTDSEETDQNSDDLVSSREGIDNISDLMTSGRQRPGAGGKRRNESDDKKRNGQRPVLLSPKENHMTNGFDHPHTAKNGGK